MVRAPLDRKVEVSKFLKGSLTQTLGLWVWCRRRGEVNVEHICLKISKSEAPCPSAAASSMSRHRQEVLIQNPRPEPTQAVCGLKQAVLTTAQWS